MKLITPNNIFCTLFILAMDEELRPDIEVKESSLISAELNDNEDYVGIIPSFDLITNKDFFVSSKFGIGFESALSNSYIYFSSNDDSINTLLLRGDITTNEVILSKIIFKERYNLAPDISIDMQEEIDDEKNYLIVGNENWSDDKFKGGSSFCEQISDQLEVPYLNFIIASKSKKTIEEFNSKFKNMNNTIKSTLSANLKKIGLSVELNEFIKTEFDTLYLDLSQNEIEGLKESLQLAYYHQIYDDIFDIKFVE